MPFTPLAPELREAFGHADPTEVQAASIPLLLDGQDVLAVAPTGTGKTAAFLLPILHQLGSPAPAPRALVMSPTRELAEQTGATAVTLGRALGLRTVVLVGGVAESEQLSALAEGADLLVATPGRLLDLLDRRLLDLVALRHWVLDEADQLLDLGFLPDLQQLARRLPPRQTSMFSATFPDASLAEALDVDPIHLHIDEIDPPLDRIDQHVYYVRKADKHQLLAHVLADAPRALVFVRTRATADRAVELLAQRGLPAVPLHGEKRQATRREALRAFREGRTGILVATDVAARGLHLPGLHLVVNFDLPNEPETYVHRVGRTARGGADGAARSFCDPSEHPYLQRIEALVGRPLQPVVAHPWHDWDLVPHPQGSRKKGAAKARMTRRRRQ